MGGRQKILAAVGNPLDRATQFTGAPGQGDVFWIGAGLHAKAAAYVAHGHAYLLQRQAHDVAQGRLNARGHLRAHAHQQPPIRTDQRQLTWQNEIALAPTHKLLLGAESLSQRAESESTTSRFYPARQIGSVLAGYSGSVERAEFQLNLRNDRYSDFGRTNSYFAAAGYNFTNEWKAIAQQSTAFKAPTFNDLYFPNFGSPNLLPERAKSQEFGLQWASGPHLLRVTRFRTDYTDLIVSAGTPARATNVAKARVNGVETNYNGQWFGFDLRTNLTLQDPVSVPADAVTGPQLRRRARAFGNIGVYRSVGPWRFGADLYATNKRVDTDITAFPSEKVGLASYNLLTLTARYNVTKEIYIAAKVDNATNAQYQLVHGYNTPQRGFFLTFGYQPK